MVLLNAFSFEHNFAQLIEGELVFKLHKLHMLKLSLVPCVAELDPLHSKAKGKHYGQPKS